MKEKSKVSDKFSMVFLTRNTKKNLYNRIYTTLPNNLTTRAYGYIDAEYGLYPYTLDYASKQDCPIAPCPECSHPGVWVQPMLDLEDEWYGSNPNCPTCGNICSMLDGCVM